MATSNKDIIHVLAFSTILVFVPLFIFPNKFGMGLATSSLTFSMFEIIFYGIVFYFFNSRASLIQLFAGAGLTFLYRIVIGTLFGMILAFSYGMDLSVSLTLGVSRYLPAILIQILVAPFIMKPFFARIVDEPSAPRRRMSPPKPVSQDQNEPDQMTFRPKTSESPNSARRPRSRSAMPEIDTTNVAVNYNTNGFERAVRYIGEHHAVLVAAVVDQEGLLLASFRREFENPEFWSAYSLLFQKANDDLLSRSGCDFKVENIDLSFETNRLSIERVGNFNLLVLSNNEEDDLLRIRLTQGADIVRKYSSERYGRILSAGTEEKYVSST
ncbi:MAG: hypothetical protein ABIJ45_12365 [Candidatus Zixiibacteriota bacterium]